MTEENHSEDHDLGHRPEWETQPLSRIQQAQAGGMAANARELFEAEAAAEMAAEEERARNGN